MTASGTLCQHFVERIYEGKAQYMTLKYTLYQSAIRNLCPRCAKARAIVLPRGYADLKAQARCSCCGEIELCVDPDVVFRYAAARLDPSIIFLHRLPVLRQPLHGDSVSLAAIDAAIAPYVSLTGERT